MAPTPPEYGFGPANFASQGGDPFSAFDNRIKYQDMVRYQMISQYHQDVVRPATMTLSQQRAVATQARFQYGVAGGQDPRFYERQAQMKRMAYSGSLTGGVMDLAMWGATDMLTGAAFGWGTGGIKAGLAMTGMGGMAASAAIAAVPAYFVGRGISNAMDKRRTIQSIAGDLDQYRDQLGFSGGLSFDRSTQLATRINSSMSAPGQFFSKTQQQEIHKIALSNNMISAKGGGINSGSIKQYQKNLEDLISTTQDIVKLLNTTKEGGLSVIQELRKSGFGNIQQIKQQVATAKAIGGVTGLGAQNMMQIGAAGAMAVQGTSWSAAAGAGAYQMGAASAQQIATSGRAGAYAVDRVGGVAQAGGVIGRFAMNFMQSGIGHRMAAYALDPSTEGINNEKMSRLLSGKMSGYDIVTGGNQVGYALGENRVRFGMMKEDMFNQMSEMEKTKFVSAGFSAWSKQRPYSSFKNKAWVFAGLYTNDPREQRLIYENLRTGKDYGAYEAQSAVDMYSMETFRANKPFGFRANMRKMGKGLMKPFNALGEGILDTSENLYTNVGGITSGLAEGVSVLGERIIGGGSAWVDRSGLNRDVGAGYKRLYGADISYDRYESSITKISKDFIDKRSQVKSNIGFDIQGIMARARNTGNVGFLQQQLVQAISLGKTRNLLDSPDFMNQLGLNKSQIVEFRKNADAGALELVTGLGSAAESVASRYEKAVGKVQTFISAKNQDPEKVRRGNEYIKNVNDALQLNARLGVNLDTTLSTGGKIFGMTRIGEREVRTPRTYAPGTMNTYNPDEVVRTSARYTVSGEGIAPEFLEVGRSMVRKKQMEGIDTLQLKHARQTAEMTKSVGVTEEMLGIKSFMMGSEYGGMFGTKKKIYYKPSKQMLKEFKSGAYGFDLTKETGRYGLAEELFNISNAVDKSDQQLDLLNLAKKHLGDTGIESAIQAFKDIKTASVFGKSGKQAITFLGGISSDTFGEGKDKLNYDKFSGSVIRAFTGQSTLEEMKKNLFSGASGTAIALRKNVPLERLGEFKTQEEAVQFLREGVPIAEKGSPQDNIKHLNEQLMEVGKAISGETTKKFTVTTKDGSYEQELDPKDLKRAERVEKDLKRMLNQSQNEFLMQMLTPSSQGRGINTNVRPPIMNYWNNRWVL